jgi:hypothetical protein
VVDISEGIVDIEGTSRFSPSKHLAREERKPRSISTISEETSTIPAPDGCHGIISGADTPLPPHLRREVVELLAAALVADFLGSTGRDERGDEQVSGAGCEGT